MLRREQKPLNKHWSDKGIYIYWLPNLYREKKSINTKKMTVSRRKKISFIFRFYIYILSREENDNLHGVRKTMWQCFKFLNFFILKSNFLQDSNTGLNLTKRTTPENSVQNCTWGTFKYIRLSFRLHNICQLGRDQ